MTFDPGRLDELDELYERALELPPEERERFARENCSAIIDNERNLSRHPAFDGWEPGTFAEMVAVAGRAGLAELLDVES